MLDSDVLDISFAMQLLLTLPGICVIPLKLLSNYASASAWVLLGTLPKVPGKAPRPSLNRLPCFQRSRFTCSRTTMKNPDNLGFVRKVPARRSRCVENRLGMLVDNQSTPLPRLFSPCLIAARLLFVQTLMPNYSPAYLVMQRLNLASP